MVETATKGNTAEKEGGTAGLSKANRRVLQRWRKQRRGEQPASGSGSAPPPPSSTRGYIEERSIQWEGA